MTSFAFMLDEVPEPVWKTSIGNWLSCAPDGDLGGGAGDRLGDLLVEQAQLAVDLGRGALDAAEPVDDLGGHGLAGDLEVRDSLRGLAAVQLPGHGFGTPEGIRGVPQPYAQPQNAAISRATDTGSS